VDKLGITIFDIAVIVVALFGAALGMSAGFAHSILFIASWAGAAWVAWRFHGLVTPEIAKLVNSPELSEYVSLLVVFVGALIVLVMLTHALSRSIRASPLRKPDQILGAGFGVLCAWVAMGFMFLFYSYLGPRQLPPVVEGAASFPLIKEMAAFVEPYLPSGFRTRLQHPGQDASPPPAALPADQADPGVVKPPQ
jgi:membrane protein required for colicin V production